MSQPTLAFSPAITIVDGQPTILSTDLARHFGKRHDDVLRAIDNLCAQLDTDHLRNFAETEECRSSPLNGAPISARAYRLTRDGFTLLAMGFTGKKALAFKLAYIDAFNRMETELQKPAPDLQRIQLAHRLAAQAAAQVTQTVFDAVMAADASGWMHGRYLLSLGYDREGQATVPTAIAIAHDQMVFSLPSLSQHIASGESMSSDAQLATLATACTQRLAARAQHREKQVTLPVYPGKPAAAPGAPQMTFK